MRLLIEGIRKGYLFSEKCYIKGEGVGFSGFFFCFNSGLHGYFQAFWPV